MSNQQQYDVDEEMIKLYHKKQKLRNEAKSYFRQFIMNPHRSVENITPFDPVLFRYNALHPYQIEHFRPNPKNTLWLLGYMILPIVGVYSYIRFHRNNKEKKLRSGEVAYKDREFKMIM